MNLTESICRNNALNLINFLKRDSGKMSSGDFDTYSRLPATHTFDMSKLPMIFRANMETSGLVSRFRRDSSSAETDLLWNEVISLYLHKYICCYCGTHDPFYAKAVEPSPVGVFIKRDHAGSDVSKCNVSYRDLYSSQKWINGKSIRGLSLQDKLQTFFSIVDLSEIMWLDVRANFGGSLWSHWGNPNEGDFKLALLSDKIYERNFELHYLGQIPIDAFMGLIYPRRHVLTAERQFQPAHVSDPDLIKIKQLRPDLGILFYQNSYDIKERFMNFIEASFYASVALVMSEVFPINIEVAKEIASHYI
ncbi:hypothetical protein TRIP_C50010 [Candidatus Zixiibacteriota bacterium]|nr:hypothetical protein TRIP_C50010 [candidate division Zixibacteria bacterium]